MSPESPAWNTFADRTAGRTAVALLLTVVCTGAVLLTGPLGIAVALLLVYAWRRVAGRPWSGVGLRLTWTAVPHVLLGAAAAAAAALAANAAAVALGAARWTPGVPDGLLFLPVVIGALVVVQSLSEEVLWRGNHHDILADRLPPPAVIALSSVFFGAMHLLPLGVVGGSDEVALSAVGAAALGFACAASRVRTGIVWGAIGVHSGFDLANSLFPVEGADPTVWLTAQALAVAALGLLLLVGFRRRDAAG